MRRIFILAILGFGLLTSLVTPAEAIISVSRCKKAAVIAIDIANVVKSAYCNPSSSGWIRLKSTKLFVRFTFRAYAFYLRVSEILFNRNPAGLVLVSGPAHSGTTILAQMVGNLPECELINYETGFFLNHEGFKVIPRLISSRKKWVIEKTPLHLYRIEEILKLLPDSKHLIIYRDPKDTVASVSMRLEGNFEEAMNATRDSFEKILKVKSLRQVKIISYEELVLKREETLSGICKWLGIKMELSILDVTSNDVFFGTGSGKNTSGFGTADHVLRRRWQVRQPFFDGRGRHLHILTPKQMNLIDSEFRHMMNSLTSN